MPWVDLQGELSDMFGEMGEPDREEQFWDHVRSTGRGGHKLTSGPHAGLTEPQLAVKLRNTTERVKDAPGRDERLYRGRLAGLSWEALSRATGLTTGVCKNYFARIRAERALL